MFLSDKAVLSVFHYAQPGWFFFWTRFVNLVVAEPGSKGKGRCGQHFAHAHMNTRTCVLSSILLTHWRFDVWFVYTAHTLKVWHVVYRYSVLACLYPTYINFQHKHSDYRDTFSTGNKTVTTQELPWHTYMYKGQVWTWLQLLSWCSEPLNIWVPWKIQWIRCIAGSKEVYSLQKFVWENR